MTYPADIVDRALSAVRGGSSTCSVALELGVSRTVVGLWCKMAGIPLRRGKKGGPVITQRAEAADPRPRTSPRSRLTYADRVRIQDGLAAKTSFRQIARQLGFSHTTISREVAAHLDPHGRYSADIAQVRSDRARARPRKRKLDEPRLRAYVAAGLEAGWSPEQICGTMRLEFPGDEEMRLSHETIYRALYVQGKGSLRAELACEQALRSGRKGRKPQSRLPKRSGSRRWTEGHEIATRPPEADGRAVPGHWEGDLVVGGDMASCLVTLVERSTRFLVMSRLDAHDAETVADRLALMASRIPEELRATLTWDQGCEMARWPKFAEASGFEVYFCDPHSPWQRGTNENTNGLIRQYFPKGTRFDEVGDEEVAQVQDALNARPRKTLGFRTPAQKLAEALGVVHY